MATKNEPTAPKSLKQHPEPARIAAHKEAARLKEHTDEEVVPAVTADVDETPKTVRYGAAILLGLAFGVGCYVWFGQDATDAQVAADSHSLAYNQNSTAPRTAPNPFYSGLDANYTKAGALLREAADAESVAPVADINYAVTEPQSQAVAAADAGTVVYLFEFDSAEVPENRELTSIAKHAVANGLCLDVRAYTDDHGRLAYNQRLSERRARAIGDYLIAHGVPAEKVSVHGMGPTHAYGNDAQDRRAEVVEIRR